MISLKFKVQSLKSPVSSPVTVRGDFRLQTSDFGLARLGCALALGLLLAIASSVAEGTNSGATTSSEVAAVTNEVVTASNVVATTSNAVAATSNAVAATSSGLVTASKAMGPTFPVAGVPAELPDMAGSVVRMVAGLAFVIALFFGGVWLFKNWQRTSRVRSKSKLNVFEARALGPRQALYVVGYNQQRFLVAASQAGISLISALPAADHEEDATTVVTNGAASFAQVLQNVLGRR